MLEIASQMVVCLLLAALLGFIIGYLFGKGTCAKDDCGHTTEVDHEHDMPNSHEVISSSAVETDNTDVASISTNADTATTQNDDKPILLSEPRNGIKDNLSRIKGIGIKIEETLNDIGIYHFDQIAAWDAENIAWADSTLGFPGRAEREDWVGQAKALAEGKETEFSKRVDEGKVSSSNKA